MRAQADINNGKAAICLQNNWLIDKQQYMKVSVVSLNSVKTMHMLRSLKKQDLMREEKKSSPCPFS